jgi:hypothetical protein
VTIGGGYFFIGDTNSRFKALDQQSGEIVWETILSAPDYSLVNK